MHVTINVYFLLCFQPNRYLSGGPFFETYSDRVYRIGRFTSDKIIQDTCTIIYEELSKTEFMTYNAENWKSVADSFEIKWNIPNCIGAIDGKHIRIICPPNAGSLYFNHKVSCKKCCVCVFFINRTASIL